MGERTVQAGGFRLTVGVPDRWAKAVRGAIGREAPPRGNQGDQPDGGLVVRPVLAVPFERRDPDAGLGFVRDRIRWRVDHRLEAAPDEVEDTAEALARCVAARPWYHTIELPHGIVTHGAYDNRALVPHYGIPADLRGQRPGRGVG